MALGRDDSEAPAETVLLRVMVGGVFLSEGLQKFLFAAELGAGRFARIGLPAPELLGPLVGCVEVVAGALVLVGLGTRRAAVPLLVVMLGALMTTKLPILLGSGFWGLSVRQLPVYGFWAAAHEARTDLCMLLGAAFLFRVGPGPWSLDAYRAGKEDR